jgi:hypothetical protein
MATQHEALRSLASLFPGAVVESIQPLGDAPGATGEKALGYGEPSRVVLRDPAGARHVLVFHTQGANEFGHDRRADRIESAVLAFDVFGQLPRHVRALDVGLVTRDGGLLSLRDGAEPYLVTEWAEGTLYVEDLRRVAAAGGEPHHEDLARCDALARYLAQLHAGKLDDRVAWRRSVRDLLGHGEGLFGVVDAWPDDVPGVPPERLRAIEERCLAWRWKLRPLQRRLSRTHGDFHPFNVVFRPPRPGEEATHLALLDASRGGRGDPADDVTALSVNFPFLALAAGGDAWRGLGPLWRRFWERYLALSGDAEVLEVAPPFWAWRALVVASPRFYPGLAPAVRDALVRLAEGALEEGRLALDLPDRVLARAGRPG